MYVLLCVLARQLPLTPFVCRAASSATAHAEATANIANQDVAESRTAQRQGTAPAGSSAAAGKSSLQPGLRAQVAMGYGSSVLHPEHFGFDPHARQYMPHGPGVRRKWRTFAEEQVDATIDRPDSPPSDGGEDGNADMHPIIAKFSPRPSSSRAGRSKSSAAAKANYDPADLAGRKKIGPAAAAARARAARRRRFGARRSGMQSSAATSDARKAREEQHRLQERMRITALATDAVDDIPLHMSTQGVLRMSRVPPSLLDTTPRGLRQYLPDYLKMHEMPVSMHQLPREGHRLVPRSSTMTERIASLYPEYQADYAEAVSMLPGRSGGETAKAVERALRGAAPHEALRPNVMDELDDGTALGVAEYLRERLLKEDRVPVPELDFGASTDAGQGSQGAPVKHTKSGLGNLSPANAHRQIRR